MRISMYALECFCDFDLILFVYYVTFLADLNTVIALNVQKFMKILEILKEFKHTCRFHFFKPS